MKQTTIAFFVRNVDADQYPFSVRYLYYRSYQEYLLAMKQAGAHAYFVTDNDSYLGGGRFKRGWTIDKVSEVADFQEVADITADVVFNKGGFEGTDVTVVTDRRLEPLIGNKGALYEKFARYQPKSVVCADAAAVAQAIEEMPGELVVVKNPVSSGGRQVYIGKKGELTVPESETYPLLVQEFIDMSGGAPGLAKGVHDLRVLMTGPKVIGATLREPQPGKLHANVSQGASERFLSVEEIPEDVGALAREIDAQLPDLPRYYAIDFAHGKQGWVMVELNTKPGLTHEGLAGPLARDFMVSLAEYLVSLA